MITAKIQLQNFREEEEEEDKSIITYLLNGGLCLNPDGKLPYCDDLVSLSELFDLLLEELVRLIDETTNIPNNDIYYINSFANHMRIIAGRFEST